MAEATVPANSSYGRGRGQRQVYAGRLNLLVFFVQTGQCGAGVSRHREQKQVKDD